MIADPRIDLQNRQKIWDQFQMFWMDTDPNLFLEHSIKTAADSPYTIEQLHYIYSVEVRDVCKWNFWIPVAPEWAGYELNWLSEKILKNDKKRKDKSKPLKSYRHFDNWWEKISAGVEAYRQAKNYDQ